MSWRISKEEYRNLLRGRETTAKKPAKYRNQMKVVNGILFGSAKEARRYFDLLGWQQSGQIKELETQKAFSIEVNGIHICDYVADFVYRREGQLIVEDVKSAVTRRLPVFILKQKLMKAVFNIEISII